MVNIFIKKLYKLTVRYAICIAATAVIALGLLCSTAYASSGKNIVTTDGSESLLSFLNWFVYGYNADEYDSQQAGKSHILDSMLWEGSCYKAEWYPYKGAAQRWGVADPAGKWGSSGYAEKKQVDWVFRNIFNGTPADMVLQVYNTDLNSSNRYATNDAYYWSVGGLGDSYDLTILSFEKEDSLYFVKIKLSDALDDSFIGYYDAVVQQKTIDGKNYWSLYSFKKSSSDITFQKTNGFYDVSPTIWYHKPVNWATENGIAQGKGHLFDPDATCSLQEVLTFLWRAKGCPEPSISNPYANLSSTQWYYKPMVWAYENGLYTNKDAFRTSTKDLHCTRGMIIQMLWQLEGSPSAKTVQGITDVPPGSQYSQAVSWAIRSGVATGTGSSAFSPNSPCTRAQIATILYQYLVSPLPIVFND